MIDKIEVGNRYKHDSETIKVIAIGKEKVFYEYEVKKENQNEFTKYISYALEHWNEIEQLPKDSIKILVKNTYNGEVLDSMTIKRDMPEKEVHMNIHIPH